MELSGVTDADMLEMLAGFEILSEKKWDCDACLRSTDEATRNAVKGCNGGKLFTLRNGSAPFCTIDRCIGNLYSPSFGFWFRAYRQYQNGVLPFDGPLMEQPSKVLEIFSVIESLEYDRAEVQRKNAERKNGR